MPLVDIILPTYNGGKYIRAQIESLLSQSHFEINIYARDDASSDNTLDILNELSEKDKRLLIIREPINNIGLVKNIELLLYRSKAHYIMFCDQDDVWLDDKVKILLSKILDLENLNVKNLPILLHSDCFITDSELNVKGKFKGNIPLSYGLEKSLFKYHVQGASCIINHSLKNEILPFIKDVYSHDRYIHLVSEIAGKRYYTNEPLMYYRQHNNNLIGSKSFLEKITQNLFRKNQTYFISKDKDLIYSLHKEKFYENDLLKTYLIITSNKSNRIQKLVLIYSKRISIRLKELFFIIIKG